MADLTLRQMINNLPSSTAINGSALGRAFQESCFAQRVEAVLNGLSFEVSTALSEGESVVGSIADGFMQGVYEDLRYPHHIAFVRPDLSGSMDPRRYEEAIGYFQRGYSPEIIVRLMRQYLPHQMGECLNAWR